jgi:hypothetical protein
VKVPGATIMPPWQEGYMYPDARFTDEALERIIDFLREQQDADVDTEAAPDAEDGDEDDEDLQQAAARAPRA